MAEREQENSITDNNNNRNTQRNSNSSNNNGNTHRSTINNHWEYWMRLAREMKGGQPSWIVSPRLLTSEHRIRYIIQRKTQKSVMLFYGVSSSARSVPVLLLHSSLSFSLLLCLNVLCEFRLVSFFALFWFGLLICGLYRAAEWSNTYLNDNGEPTRKPEKSLSLPLARSFSFSSLSFFRRWAMN